MNCVRYIGHLQCQKHMCSCDTKIVSEYDQEKPPSQTADNPVARLFKIVSLTLKIIPHPGQPKSIVTNVSIAAVVGRIKRDARLTVRNIAHSVGISSGSAHQILTQ